MIKKIDPGHEIGPPGGHMFSRGPSKENMKKPCLKPQGLEVLYLVCRKCLCVVGEGVGSCYALKGYTTEETSLIALHQMV